MRPTTHIHGRMITILSYTTYFIYDENSSINTKSCLCSRMAQTFVQQGTQATFVQVAHETEIYLHDISKMESQGNP